MNAPDTPKGEKTVLFIPVSGPQGAGEYYRALTIAQACWARHPDWDLNICVSRDAEVERPDGIRYHRLEASPTRDSGGVERILREIRPNLVIFDSTLRHRQLKLCAQAGVDWVVYISSRPSSRRRGFGLRKLRGLDEHWLITAPDEARLTGRERCFARLNPRLKIRFLSTLFPSDTSSEASPFAEQPHVPERGYVLFVSGGGGGSVDGEPIDRIFQQAARRFHAMTGHPTVLIAGPLSTVSLESVQGRVEIRSVAPGRLAAMIDQATLVVSGGGSLVQQVLAQGRPLIAVPAGGRDQPARLERLAREKLLETCATDPEAMAGRAAALLQDRNARDSLITHAGEHGFTNDMPEVLAAVERLLGAANEAVPAGPARVVPPRAGER